MNNDLSNLSKRQKDKITDSFIDLLNKDNQERALYELHFSGLDINHISSHYDITALMIACIRGFRNLVSEILSIPSCNPKISNLKGMNALSYAVKYNQAEVIDYLINVARVDSTITIPNHKLLDHDAINMLLYSVLTSNVYIVNLFLHGTNIDPNQTDSDGNTPLLMAIKLNYLDIIDSLLKDPRTNPNKGNSNYDNQDTPLTFACILNNNDIVLLLMSNRLTNPNLTREDDISPLIIAVNQMNPTIVDYLIQHSDIEINYHSEIIESALYYACSSRNEEIMRLLLRHPQIEVGNNSYVHEVIDKLTRPLYFNDFTMV